MALASTLKRVIGRDVTVTCSGTKTLWNSLNISFAFDTEDATAADSTINEGVFTTKGLTLELTGFLGYTNNGGTLPAIGDTISDLAVAVSSDTLIPSLTAYTNIKVTDVKYDWSKGPAVFTVSARSGMLN